MQLTTNEFLELNKVEVEFFSSKEDLKENYFEAWGFSEEEMEPVLNKLKDCKNGVWVFNGEVFNASVYPTIDSILYDLN